MSKSKPVKTDNLASKSSEILNECPWFLIKKVQKFLAIIFDDILKPIGIGSSQLYLLASLVTIEDPSINSISKALGSDQTTISRNLQVLEKSNLVNIQQGSNRRTKIVRITKKGREKLEKAYPIWYSLKSRIVESIGDENAKNLDIILNDILQLSK